MLDQALAEEYAQEEDLVILCGHYEGVDQRILDGWNMEEVSVGDYILTGGEPAAIVFVDAVARLIPGVLASKEAAYEESIYSGLLESPQCTKPREYRGMEVPEVLLNGNHKAIHLWQFEQALRLTKERRPDLFEKFIKEERTLTKEEKRIVDNVLKLL
jgi:tRNA (guanine37-N1)-methyltransferase